MGLVDCRVEMWEIREALGNKAVKRSLHPDLFQMDVLVAD
jgi:hypothetical protein